MFKTVNFPLNKDDRTFMPYFNQDFIVFFTELEKNNNREWFNANKSRYEKSVKEPFYDFVQDMIFRIHEQDPAIMITPEEAIFRIYRDLRFSKDKTPYKTYVSAVISPRGRKDNTYPGVYLEVNAKYIRFYSGIYKMTKEQLQSVRSFIAAYPEEFNSLIKAKKFRQVFGKILGEQNKRVPPEFKNLLKEQPLIANKQFYYYKEINSENLLRKDLPQRLMKYYFASQPLNKFLKEGLEFTSTKFR